MDERVPISSLSSFLPFPHPFLAIEKLSPASRGRRWSSHCCLLDIHSKLLSASLPSAPTQAGATQTLAHLPVPKQGKSLCLSKAGTSATCSSSLSCCWDKVHRENPSKKGKVYFILQDEATIHHSGEDTGAGSSSDSLYSQQARGDELVLSSLSSVFMRSRTPISWRGATCIQGESAHLS